MAFTREELQAYIDDKVDVLYTRGTVRELCRALLAEMDKQKDDIWKGAPKEATEKTVTWTRFSFRDRLGENTYTRKPPKTRAVEIAEEAVSGSDMLAMFNGKPLVNVIADAILKREKELEEGK